jgi:hypothetical protein
MSASAGPAARIAPWAVLLIAVLPSAARANIGQRWWGGLVAEPEGLKDIAITEEHLTLDLRPLIRVEPIQVEAIYRLQNRGPEKHLDLVFVSGTPDVSEFDVRLDDQALDSCKVPIAEVSHRGGRLPPPWARPPDVSESEWPGSAHYMWGAVHQPTLVGFSARLPRGVHTLAARYHTRAFGNPESYPVTEWQVPYILSPAKEWRTFGGLHVTVYMPPGWECRSRPPLEREAARLHGKFDGLPADLLVISAQAPVPPALALRTNAGTACYVLAVALGGVLCWCAGARHARRRWYHGRAGHSPPRLLALVMALAWGALVYAIWSLVALWIYAVLGGQQTSGFHARFEVLAVGDALVVLMLFPAGLLLTRAGARRQWLKLWKADGEAGMLALLPPNAAVEP